MARDVALDGGESHFLQGSARVMDDPRVVARQTPGSLLRQALQQMQVYDSARVDPSMMVHGSFQRYLTTVLLPRRPESIMGMRNARELRTLAVSLDALMLGDLGMVGDCLVQRWKAVEAAVGDGHCSWRATWN